MVRAWSRLAAGPTPWFWSIQWCLGPWFKTNHRHGTMVPIPRPDIRSELLRSALSYSQISTSLTCEYRMPETSRFQICHLVSGRLSFVLLFLLLASAGCGSKPDNSWVEREILKNRCLAILENGAENDKGEMLKQATEGFRKIAKELPRDRLSAQNLCLTLLLRLKKPGAVDSVAEFATLQKEFEAAIQSLKLLATDEPDADLFMSRFHEIKNDRNLAIESLRAACGKPKATADTFYQLFDQMQLDSDPTHLPEMERALRSAIQLTPSNLVLAINLLDVLVKTKDIRIKLEIEKCRELFRPLVARTDSKIPSLLDNAIAAIDNGKWDMARTQVARLRNVMIAEIATQNDRQLLKPHELEYIQLNFDEKTRNAKSVSNPGTAGNWKMLPKEKLSFASQAVTAIATEDIDLDGHSDLVVAMGSQLDVWKTDDPASPKKLLSATIGISCSGIVLADLDHDYQPRNSLLPPSALPTTAPPDVAGEESAPPLLAKFLDTDVDVVVYGTEGIRLYRNDLDSTSGERSLKEMLQSSEFDNLKDVRTVVSIDFDHDSDLDLVVSSATGISLWSNRGDWTFADFTEFSNLPAEAKNVDSILAMDLDRNVLNDFLLGGEDLVNPILLSNNLHGRYRPSGLDWKKGLKGSCRAVEAIDANNDACWDIVSCGKLGTKLTTMKSIGRHSWIPDQVSDVSATPMIGLAVSDLDFDGYADCIAWGSKGIELFRSGKDGRLRIAKDSLKFSESTLQAVVMDFDRDGDDDLVCLTSDGAMHFVENQGGSSNQHLEVVIRADEDGKQRPRERCNMHGVGSLIELKSAELYQSRIVRGTRTKFGLGQKTGADIMRVLWTNGIPNNVIGVDNRTTVFDQQELGGSCPYLYAWNGERFEFCTDCLWAAPIGLQFAQGVSAPTREWEYLKIDGDQVKPLNGRYVLQITEELWEAGYFDAVQLMAIDHPREVEIYTNEKVGPAELAEFRIHAVRDRLTPRTVKDQRGNDLSELVSQRDQRFTRCWKEGYNQGLVEKHWLEVDLNRETNGEDDAEVKLFLTGWVFPTCTSLNLAMTENPLRPKLSPPSIQVPDENGNWVEVIPYAGFPGGKTKTIAIDLSGKFKSNDHRVRVVTNMELCWDEVFWTSGDGKSDTTDYQLTQLELLKANLRYRGFSKLEPQPGNAPKRFAYEKVTSESIWPPMSGRFTRFGDVRDLIAESDDLQVVMGAGDEMTLEFAAETRNLPEGWKRDFVIYNVGWDKDADLNTVHGQTVEPLPFRGMTKYPYEPDQTFPSEPKHIDYLKRYQTRIQAPGSFWNQVREN